MSNETATLLQTVGNVASLTHELKSTSLTEFTEGTRVEPLAFIDEGFSAIPQDTQSAVMQTLLSIYSAHYLQAVSLIAQVGNVKAVNIIDRFATDRDPYINAGQDNILERSSKAFGIESLHSLSATVAGLENKDVTGPSNLAVGKVLNVPIQVGETKMNVMTTVRLLPQRLDQKSMLTFLSAGSKDNSVAGRFRRWRSGELSFADYALCLDLIENDKKVLLNDKNGIHKRAKRSKRRGFLATVLSGKGSNNIASAITVITKNTAKQLEVAMRGKFSRGRDVRKFFEETNSMILAVVDPNMETFTLYQRGIEDGAIYTFDDIEKNSTNANGVDINDVLKAYRLGNSPGL